VGFQWGLFNGDYIMGYKIYWDKSTCLKVSIQYMIIYSLLGKSTGEAGFYPQSVPDVSEFPLNSPMIQFWEILLKLKQITNSVK
jgi:hypothetical protein